MDHMWILWRGFATNIFLEVMHDHKRFDFIRGLQGWGRVAVEVCLMVKPSSNSQEP